MKDDRAIFTKRAVSAAFKALDEGNADDILSHWKADCAFFFPGKFKTLGLYAGRTALRKWLED